MASRPNVVLCGGPALDAPARDSDVGVERLGSGPVDDQTVSDYQIDILCHAPDLPGSQLRLIAFIRRPTNAEFCHGGDGGGQTLFVRYGHRREARGDVA